ncbi:transmembrane protein 104-like isoform X2 [Mercenaria mercenaria]|uniref:transmembrane protein 104-like isoform X2 n=1 Tax=Mercenaria mercenaria TaxID=6596 RepID=UPI00234FA06F|nr:transmembrane protein 104-like isoform X2 [Mercenaria mercenaria]
MAGDIGEVGTHYSKSVGLIYVFNLIVGTGALTMPKAFEQAGWILSLITIIILSFMSFLTVTFVTEAMGIANALLKKKDTQKAIEDSEETPLIAEHPDTNPFEISMRTELGHMAGLFFNKIGILVFNLCIVIYLYGDLSIYAAAVPKSIRDIACTYKHQHNASDCSDTVLTDSDLCWSSSTLTRMSMYRICVAGFFLLLGGFTFFNVQKTKYLQLVTTASRWLAFGMMIVLAVIRLDKKKGQGHPPYADISGIPNLFGVCVYSFMCHHSLPSLITPIKNKSKLYHLLACDYVLILIFYLLLSLTGIYSFNELNDIYTLNFLPDPCDESKSITDVKFIQYFLALFPVFTLSTNFPIISITLRNNLKAIGYKEDRPYTWCVDRIFFPLLALVPPLGIALATNHVEFLVGITGSYAGAGIQYVIPAVLVFCARKQTSMLFSEKNIHVSPFKGKFWIVFVCIWAVVCMAFVTVNHIISGK